MPDPTPAAGSALDAEVGRLLGLDVLGIAPCSQEPECGEWEPTGHWAEPGYAGDDRPVYLRSCSCEFARKGNARVLGHLQWCLDVVPAYSTEIAAAWTVVEHLRSQGFTTEIDICAHECNGKEFTCVFSDENSAADTQPTWDASAETMPLAIALAALRALALEATHAGDGG